MGYRWILHAVVVGVVLIFGFVVVAAISGGLGAESEAQDEFVDVVAEASAEASGTDNDLAINRALEQRGAALCDLLGPDLEAVEWVGDVEDVGSALFSEDGVLIIAITDDIAVRTNSDTRIEPGSDLHETLIGLREGDRVRFSGSFVADEEQCVRETSLLNENSLATPDFGFKFETVVSAE